MTITYLVNKDRYPHVWKFLHSAKMFDELTAGQPHDDSPIDLPSYTTPENLLPKYEKILAKLSHDQIQDLAEGEWTEVEIFLGEEDWSEIESFIEQPWA